MKILVVSDSHGGCGNFLDVIEKHSDINTIVFLGDGADDLEAIAYYLKDKKVIKVCGNCDFSCRAPYCVIENINGKKVYCTHGHMEHVKYGLEELKLSARSENAEIALYGHTHVQFTDYDDGLYVFNPGSLRDGKYGIVDIVKQGISINEMKLW